MPHREPQKKILFLTHSDIRHDSRILKAMSCGVESGFQVFGLCLRESEPQQSGPSSLEDEVASAEDTNIKAEPLWVDALVDYLCVRGMAKWARFWPTPLWFLELWVKFLIRGLLFRPTVIHCNDWLVLPAGVALKWLVGAKLIYDAHELESETQGISENWRQIILRVEKLSWSHVDYFITVSDSIQQWYFQRFGNKQSALILNSPVDRPIGLEPSYLRNKFSIPEGSNIFLHIGALTSGRGVELCIDTFSRSTDLGYLVFLGYGKLESYVRDAQKKNTNIFIHERVPHDQVVEVARTADYGLCLIERASLSDFYSVPNKFLEYAVSGLKLISSSFPEIEKLTNRHRLGHTIEPNADVLEQFLLELGKSEPFNLQAVDLDQLEWNQQARVQQHVYSSLVEGAHPEA